MKDDIRKPRKYKSPYSLYMQEMRPIFCRKYPEHKMMKIIIELSKLWGQMTAEEKQKYVDQSEQDRARYQQEAESFIRARHHFEQRLGPKPAFSGYMIFCRYMRQQAKQQN
jgi:hypothetical protein